jgi:hypothetical protein
MIAHDVPPGVVLATYYTNFEPSEAGHAEN